MHRTIPMDEAKDYLKADSRTTIHPDNFGTELVKALDDALARHAGGFVNPRGVRVREFEFRFYTTVIVWPGGGSVFTNCLVRRSQDSRVLDSSVRLWPVNDFWVLQSELNDL